MLVIFDLDGTLCNIEHRLHYITKPNHDWPGFFKACVNDRPEREMISVYHALRGSGHHRVEIWSGRSDVVRKETWAWLTEYLPVTPDVLRMRKAGDHTQDHVLKESWLHAETILPDLVFDDRQQVVDMWRRNGIKCCQVADGKF